MPRMGRLRRSNQHLPPGVREIPAGSGNHYWRPSSATARQARKAAGLPTWEALGKDLDQVRRRWGELQRLPHAEDTPLAGTLGELLEAFERLELPGTKSNGKPRYADKTRTEYARSLAVLRREFGAREYARSEAEASRGGKLRVADLQRWMHAQDKLIQANRHLAVLSVVFGFARRMGHTEYNPCLGVERHQEEPRERDVEPWEIEALIAACAPVRGLMVRLVDACGMRLGDVLALTDAHLKAHGIDIRQGKRGRRWSCEWSPALREIIREAQALRPALPEDAPAPIARHVFCNLKGTRYTVDGFESVWSNDLQRVNRLLTESIEHDIPELRVALAPQIVDLHFHDIRKKSGNDAQDQGQAAHQLLGNDPATARRHYTNVRAIKARPTK